jgi:hypothetical protein
MTIDMATQGQPPIDPDKLRVVWCDELIVHYTEYRKEVPINRGVQRGVIWDCWRCGNIGKDLREEIHRHLVLDGDRIATQCPKCKATFALSHRLIETPGEVMETIARGMKR